jgi:hypothetical protein
MDGTVPPVVIEKESPHKNQIEVLGRPPEAIPEAATKCGQKHRLIPCSMATAAELCDRFHRHNGGLPLALFAVGIECDGVVVGAAIVGMPATKSLMDGYTVELRRAVVLGEHKNANSMLYGAAWRGAQALGYKRMFTYTLESESSSSPKAIGMTVDHRLQNDSFDSWQFYRDIHGSADPIRSPPPGVVKLRWVITTEDWAGIAKLGRPVYPAGMMEIDTGANLEAEW